MNTEDIAALQDVRLHLKEMRAFLLVECRFAVGTRQANNDALAKVSDVLLRNGAA